MKNNAPEFDQKDVVNHLFREGLEKDRKFKLQVSSQSMAPLLNQGDMVIIKRVHPTLIRPGDLVVVRQKGEPVIHRVITIKRDGHFNTKGDNLPTSDPPLSAVEMLGRVVAIEKGNSIIDLTSSNWARINRTLALISNLESISIQSAVKMGGVLSRHKIKMGQLDPQGYTKDTNSLRVKGKGISLLRLPFRSMIRFVIRLAQIDFLKV